MMTNEIVEQMEADRKAYEREFTSHFGAGGWEMYSEAREQLVEDAAWEIDWASAHGLDIEDVVAAYDAYYPDPTN